MELTQEWINQYNKKCAEFLGAYWCNDDLNAYPSGYWMLDGEDNLPHDLEHMEFHSDWNWIMEVVEKIESIKQLTLETCNNWVGEFTIVIRYKSYSSTHYFSREIPRVSHGQDFRTKKEAVIQAIDQFIDWYNKQKES